MHIRMIHKNEAASASWGAVPAAKKTEFFTTLNKIAGALGLGIYKEGQENVKNGESDTILIVDGEGHEDPDYGGPTQEYCNSMIRKVRSGLAKAGFKEKEIGFHLEMEYLRGEESQDIYMNIEDPAKDASQNLDEFSKSLAAALKKEGCPKIEKPEYVANHLKNWTSPIICGSWPAGAISERDFKSKVEKIGSEMKSLWNMRFVFIYGETTEIPIRPTGRFAKAYAIRVYSV